MSRNLKALLIAGLAATALGAQAGSALGADEFHCSVSPCRRRVRPDGTGKTAHQVIIIENKTLTESVSFTCAEVTGEAESAAAISTEFEMRNIVYSSCTVNGSAGLTIDMNGCTYRFTAFGGRTDQAEVHIVCPTGKKIQLTYNGCVAEIGSQRIPSVGYHTVGTTPTREVTMTMSLLILPPIVVTGSKAQCLINPEQELSGTYTTGNSLITGETPAGAMADLWYE